MGKLNIGDTITLDNIYYIIVLAKGHKCQGFNCAYCDMVTIVGTNYQCNLMRKDGKFDCRKMMPFGTQFRKIGKGGV